MASTETTNSPFFVVGVHRSGTTLLRLMLNNHPRLAVPFETVFIIEFYRKLERYGDLSVRANRERLLTDITACERKTKGDLVQDPEALLAQPVQDYAGLVDAIFSEYAKRKGKQRWGDKTPSHVTELDVICKLFPDCRIVHLVRDGRDVALSMRRIDWGSSHIPTVAQNWRWMTTLGRKMGAFLGDRYCEVHYEDLIGKPEETLRFLCKFLGEPYHEDVLRHHLTAKQEMPEESMKWHSDSVRMPDPAKVFAWKHRMSLADRIIFEQVAGRELAMFGYETEQHPPTLGSRLKSLYYKTIKRW